MALFCNHLFWGKLLAITDGSGNDITGDTESIGYQNPFRYRDYYYDSETGFYWLQSRYYDPVIGRFINADSMTDGGAGLLGNNLYVYCANDPVNAFDPTGQEIWWIDWGKAILDASKERQRCLQAPRPIP